MSWTNEAKIAFTIFLCAAIISAAIMLRGSGITGFAAEGANNPGCVENWVCNEWSHCEAGMQARTCIDTNKCNTVRFKPVITSRCRLPVTHKLQEKIPVREAPLSAEKTASPAKQKVVRLEMIAWNLLAKVLPWPVAIVMACIFLAAMLILAEKNAFVKTDFVSAPRAQQEEIMLPPPEPAVLDIAAKPPEDQGRKHAEESRKIMHLKQDAREPETRAGLDIVLCRSNKAIISANKILKRLKKKK